MLHTTRCAITALLVAALGIVGLAQTAIAQQASPVTITGQIQLPKDGAPDWYNGPAYELGNVMVYAVEKFQRPPLPMPDDFDREAFGKMTRAERNQWRQDFQQSDAFKQWMRQSEEAYKNRAIIEGTIADDGGFRITHDFKPGMYTVVAGIPHASAEPLELPNANWGAAMQQVAVRGTDVAIDAPFALKPKNTLEVGDPAPEWSGTRLDGEPVSLSDFRGKYVLLDFWATWCGPCIGEIPNLKSIYSDHGGDNFEIIALSLDKNIDLPKKFVAENPSPYTHIYLGNWGDITVGKEYGFRGIPSIWLIGPDGKVAAKGIRGPRIRKAVEEALNVKAVAQAE